MAIQHPSFGTLDPDRIIVFDTTLRDGEQSPGFSMNLEEKLRMAEALWELGVDVMEAGFCIGDVRIQDFLMKSYGVATPTPPIEVFLKVIVDVKGSPFDPECEQKITVV